MFLSVCFILSGTTKCQAIVKGCRKTPTFSNRVTREEGDAATIAKTWDDARELKRRIWLDFWDGAFLFLSFLSCVFLSSALVERPHAGGQDGGDKKMNTRVLFCVRRSLARAAGLINAAFEGTEVPARFLELKEIGQDKGLARIRAHYEASADPRSQKTRGFLVRSLEVRFRICRGA